MRIQQQNEIDNGKPKTEGLKKFNPSQSKVCKRNFCITNEYIFELHISKKKRKK